MLGHDDLGDAREGVAALVFEDLVILRAVDEADHVRVLLDGARLTQVGQLRALPLDALARLHATVELREGDDGDVQLLGQPFERARDGAHLLLTATEVHAAGVHQLEVVDEDALDLVLAHEAPRLGAKLEDGEARGVVDVDWRVVKVLDLVLQLLPLVLLQSAALDLLARQLADVHDEAVHELHVAHLKREHGHGHLERDGHIAGHGEHEGRLTHRGAGGDDDEVGVLPPGRDLVQVGKAGGQSAEALLPVGCPLEQLARLLDDGVDLHGLVADVLLRDAEKLALGLLHELFDLDRLVVGLALDLACVADQFAGQELLGHDLRVTLEVSCAAHVLGQLGDVERPADRLQVAVFLQLIDDGQHVDGVLARGQIDDGLIDLPVCPFVEALGLERFVDLKKGVLFEHERTEDSLFQVARLRLESAHVRDLYDDGLLARRAVGIVFCHRDGMCDEMFFVAPKVLVYRVGLRIRF